jgi:hypothetical protein
MNKFITLMALCAITISVNAQQAAAPVPVYEAYGKIDKEDLEMKACDFEKDASAEILIDKGDVYYDNSLNQVGEYHKRVKIFNDNGKSEANIRIEYYSANQEEYISGLQGETINMVDGKAVITKLDKKLIYTQGVDKYKSAMIFTMPDVKPGSIIEYKYTLTSTDPFYLPTWVFQAQIPTRYSEYDTSVPEWFYFQPQTNMRAPFTKRTTSAGNGNYGTGQDAVTYTTQGEQRIMINVPSMPTEFAMRSLTDNLAYVAFQLKTFSPPNSFVQSLSNTWAKVGENLLKDDDFGKQLNRKLAGEDAIIAKAKAFKTDDEKIAYLFNQVRDNMKWDGTDRWYTIDGTSKAWDTKTGNSTEINLILYHLLNKSGVKAAMPMIVSTRVNGRVNPSYTTSRQFNRGVVYIPVDSTKMYVLDATGKYNMYNETPYTLLNSSGLYLNPDTKDANLVFVVKQVPVRQAVFINAEIKPEGKMAGTVQISSFSYNRINCIDSYKTDGEKKYIDNLRGDDNNLKITSLKFDNMDVDTLPLVQNAEFNLVLTGSDDNYIYFNPNLFTSMGKNPFLSETRNTDIDFGYQDNSTINGMYKIPAGYKIDALPKNVSMSMPDQSIVFRRIIGEQDGNIAVRYTISYKKSIYFKEEYPDLHEFYKKMYEMLNEQIVLKKS